MQNNNVPESIWADGIPENIKEEDKLTLEILVGMATDYLMKNLLIPLGFKIEDGFPRPELPNIVMKKDGVSYAIIICPSVLPKYMIVNDEVRLKFVQMCKERNTTPLMAPVLYASIDKARAKEGIALKGDVFRTKCPGFIILNDEPEQDLTLTDESKLFRPE